MCIMIKHDLVCSPGRVCLTSCLSHSLFSLSFLPSPLFHCLTVSLSHTHTHTHTHSLSLSLSLSPLPLEQNPPCNRDISSYFIVIDHIHSVSIATYMKSLRGFLWPLHSQKLLGKAPAIDSLYSEDFFFLSLLTGISYIYLQVQAFVCEHWCDYVLVCSL